MKKCIARSMTIEEMEKIIDSVDQLKDSDVCKNATINPGNVQGQKCYGDKGEKLDSKFEYCFLLYWRTKGMFVERNTLQSLSYFDVNGKKRKFFPDFTMNGIFYEVKGFLRPNDEQKMLQHPEVKFVFGDEIKEMGEWLDKESPGWRKKIQLR